MIKTYSRIWEQIGFYIKKHMSHHNILVIELKSGRFCLKSIHLSHILVSDTLRIGYQYRIRSVSDTNKQPQAYMKKITLPLLALLFTYSLALAQSPPTFDYLVTAQGDTVRFEKVSYFSVIGKVGTLTITKDDGSKQKFELPEVSHYYEYRKGNPRTFQTVCMQKDKPNTVARLYACAPPCLQHSL